MFDSWSGHLPRLWVLSLAGARAGGNWSMFLSHMDVSLFQKKKSHTKQTTQQTTKKKPALLHARHVLSILYLWTHLMLIITWRGRYSLLPFCRRENWVSGKFNDLALSHAAFRIWALTSLVPTLCSLLHCFSWVLTPRVHRSAGRRSLETNHSLLQCETCFYGELQGERTQFYLRTSGRASLGKRPLMPSHIANQGDNRREVPHVEGPAWTNLQRHETVQADQETAEAWSVQGRARAEEVRAGRLGRTKEVFYSN